MEGHTKLLKASEGARELIRMIDSLTNSTNLDVRTKHVARKLLKGARELQSSLAMLTGESRRSVDTSLRTFTKRMECGKEEVSFVMKKSRFTLQSAFKLERIEELRGIPTDKSEAERRKSPDPHPYDTSRFHKRGGGFNEKDDIPPIVIMKPLFTISAKEEFGSTREEAKKIKDVNASDTTAKTENQASTGKTKTQSKNSISSGDTETDEMHFEEGKRSNAETGKDSYPKSRTWIARDFFDDNRQENLVEATRMPSELEQDIMCLLLSSRSFVNQAKELFRIDAGPPVIHNRKRLGEDVTRNPKLYLDCGKELMARRSRERDAGGLSLRQLAEEVSRAIEALSSFGGAGPEDDLYVRLERDLECREVMAIANWDMGWVNWTCSEELNVVADLEEFIMSWLIIEAIQDLCLL